MNKYFSRMIVSSVLLILAVSCSGISVIQGPDSSKLYRDSFKEHIQQARSLFTAKKTNEALKKLHDLADTSLLPVEVAFKYNLIGVIHFNTGKLEEAINYFNKALPQSSLDSSLAAQIYLNLASCYYKLGLAEKAYSYIMLGDYRSLAKNEQQKFFLLRYRLSKELGQQNSIVTSLIGYLGIKESIDDLRNDNLYQVLMDQYSKISYPENIQLLMEFEKSQFIVVAYMAYLEAEKLYYSGMKSQTEDLLKWVSDNFKAPQIEKLISDFTNRIQNVSKIEANSIGVILPLGDKEKAQFARRVLLGMDAFLANLNKKVEVPYKIIVKDSKGSGSAGAYMVKDLISKHYVSVIIGGLFPNEAAQEYLEAKKNGAIFISLSEVQLPAIEKGHLLIEVPGSIESQVSALLSDDFLDAFGRRVAVIYPETEIGKSYINEFWRKSQGKGVDVTNVFSYIPNQNDYRDPVKKVLGLYFKRQRMEEFELLDDIQGLEKNSTIRRVQVLMPQSNFDWVFIPSNPKEAKQIIPSFNYFDAFDVKKVGIPSWRTKKLQQDSVKLGKLFFVGNNFQGISKDFMQNFVERYKRSPGVIEVNAFDAIQLAHDIIKSHSISNREELDMALRTTENLQGVTGIWKLEDNLWLKNMIVLELYKKKIGPLQLDKTTSVNEMPFLQPESKQGNQEASATVENLKLSI